MGTRRITRKELGDLRKKEAQAVEDYERAKALMARDYAHFGGPSVVGLEFYNNARAKVLSLLD